MVATRLFRLSQCPEIGTPDESIYFNGRRLVSTVADRFKKAIACSFTKNPKHILKWASRIFGKNISNKDEEFQGTVEAYITDDSDDVNPVRIPFSEDVLKQGLKKVQKESGWSRHLALNQSNRSTLNHIMDSMRDTKDLKRTCVAFKQCAEKDQSRCTVVFFAVERKIVNFEDWRGYLFILPFSRCKQFPLSLNLFHRLPGFFFN